MKKETTKPTEKPKSKIQIRIGQLTIKRNELQERLGQIQNGLEQTKQNLIATIGAIQELEKLE